MKHWSADFHPRSLCSFGDGDGDSDGGPSGSTDSTSGDFFGDTVSNADFFGPSGPDTSSFTGDFTGPESSNVSNADFFGPSADASSFTGGPDFGDPTGSNLSNADFFGGVDVSGGPDFGDWGPTGGIDYTGGGQGFGFAGPGGPMANAGSNFYGTDVSNEFGPTLGGPNLDPSNNLSPDDLNAMQAHSPGYVAPADPLGAPNVTGLNVATPSAQFGFPMSAEALDAQARGEQGRGWIGGPISVQPGEAFPGGRGEVGPRSEAEPNFFGPANAGPQTAQSGFNLGDVFGPSAAQAASRGTDQAMISQDVLAGVNVAGRANEDMAKADPALAQALSSWASNLANIQSAGMIGPGMAGWYGGQPGQTGPFAGPSPGAQYGFTGVSPAQQSTQSFTGQPSLGNESTQGKGDRGATSPTAQAYPGVSPGFDPVTADPALQTALEARGAEMRGPEQQQAPTVQQAFESLQNISPDPALQTALEARAAEMRGPEQTQDPGQVQFASPSQRGATEDFPAIDPQAIFETIGKTGLEPMLDIDPQSRGVGREAAPLGLLSMMEPSTRGVGREAAPFGLQFGPQTVSPGSRGQTSSPGSRGQTSGRGSPSLSITVSPSGRGSPGYYSTGGRGIAPGAKGAEYGGIYGPGVATGRAGTNTFGVDSRSGAFGYFDPATGIYYGGGSRR